MSKYTDLKKKYDKLESDFQQLRKALLTDGSLENAVGFGSIKPIYAGNHRYVLAENKVKIKCIEHRIDLLEKHLGIKFEHVEVDEWIYTERKSDE